MLVQQGRPPDGLQIFPAPPPHLLPFRATALPMISAVGNNQHSTLSYRRLIKELSLLRQPANHLEGISIEFPPDDCLDRLEAVLTGPGSHAQDSN
jgi:hypothetical protein